MRKLTVLLSVLLCCSALPVMSELTHSIIINEVMQSVTRGAVDQLNEYPDGWVELYNPSDKPVTLTGYALGEQYKYSKCYIIPKATQRKEEFQWWTGQTVVSWPEAGNLTIPAKGYLTVYCDNEAVTCGTEVHTDFRMPNAKGGTLYLFDSNKNLADSMYLPPMPATDVAYGRETDGAVSLGYMLTPTKGARNSGGFAKMVLPYPVMPKSQVTEAAAGSGEQFEVAISKPAGAPADAVIRYTTDGTEPTASSALYSEPLLITKTTIVRATLFADGCVTPPAATRSFIFLGRKLTVPIVSLVTDKKNLNDSKIGIIYNNTSSDNKHNWRRPVIMDYFPGGEQTSLFNHGAEIRVSGAYSRANRQKSFIAYADSRFGFGSKDYFEAPFWTYTGSEMTKSPSIGLRSSGNDFNLAHMRDGVSQMLFGMNTDLDWQDFQPAITFMNGEYYGILNIRERANEDNIWMHYQNADGSHLSDITLLENPTWGGDALKKGDMGQYNEFTSFLNRKSTNLADYQQRMDVVEYTNFMMANIYMSNTDFPGNNYVTWRPVASGGKWRYILKDVDRSLGYCYWHPETDGSTKDGGSSSAKYLRWVLRNPADVFRNNYEANSADCTRLFRYLMAISAYKDMFIDRFTVYLGDFLTADNIASVIDETADLMSLEMEYHKKKYGGTVKEWQTELSNMKKWAKERTASMYAQLQDYFSLAKPIPSQIGDESGTTSISINDIILRTGAFDGKLFPNRTYKIKAASTDGPTVDVGWHVVCRDSNGNVISDQIKTVPEFYFTPQTSYASLTFTVLHNVSDVRMIDENAGTPVSITYYNMQGVQSDIPFDGVNVVRSIYPDGSAKTEKVIFGE